MIGYVTLEVAREYIEQRYDKKVTDEELTRGLYRALDLIESIDVRNSGRNEKQKLIFPRKCEKEVPENIKIAQSLEAFSIITTPEDPTQDIKNGITGRRIGDMSVSYGTVGTNQIDKFKNDIAKNIIKRYQRKTYGWS